VSVVRTLLDIEGYHWFSICRQGMRSSGSVRGLGGVACLTRDSLWGRGSMVTLDKFARSRAFGLAT
jgi:hypothetical protein